MFTSIYHCISIHTKTKKNMKNLLKKILVIINFGEPLPTKEDTLYIIPYVFVAFVILALVSIIEKI